MDITHLKNHVLHQNVQAIVLDENGCVLSSDDVLVAIRKDTFVLSENDVFLGLNELIFELETDEELKLDCIETEFYGRHSIYDFRFMCIQDEYGLKRYLLLLYDLEDVYNKVIDLRRERNEANIYADKLAVAHEKLKQAQLHMISNERMATIGLLAAGMAHEINNPLNYIVNGVELIKRCVVNDAENGDVSQMLEIIETGADRIKEVVSRLKIFDSSGQNEEKTIDLHATIDQTTDLVIERESKKVALTKNYSAEEILLKCNPGKISQAFFNLLANAVTFTKDIESSDIEVTTRISENSAKVFIKDNGIGIPESIKQRVLEPFFTTKKMGTGKGLGLSVANILITENGGKMTFESIEGEYTIFCVELPLSR